MNVSNRVDDYLRTVHPEGTRNNALFTAACCAFERGWTQERVKMELGLRAEGEGLSSAEATSTIESAYKKIEAEGKLNSWLEGPRQGAPRPRGAEPGGPTPLRLSAGRDGNRPAEPCEEDKLSNVQCPGLRPAWQHQGLSDYLRALRFKDDELFNVVKGPHKRATAVAGTGLKKRVLDYCNRICESLGLKPLKRLPRGKKGCIESNVIANAVRGEADGQVYLFERDHSVAALRAVARRERRSKASCVCMEEYFGNERHYVCIHVLPLYVAQFLNAFDSDLYPELENK